MKETLQLGRRQMMAISAGMAAASAATAVPLDLGQATIPVGFLPTGVGGTMCDASFVPADDVIWKTAKITVSGHLEGKVEKATLDIFFGAQGQYPFHAWEYNSSTGVEDGKTVEFIVPLKTTGGLNLKVLVEGKEHELLIDETWTGPRLRQGSYVIAIDEKGRVPRWSRIKSTNPRPDNLGLSVRLPHILVTVEAI